MLKDELPRGNNGIGLHRQLWFTSTIKGEHVHWAVGVRRNLAFAMAGCDRPRPFAITGPKGGLNTEWSTIILPRQLAFSDTVAVGAGLTVSIVDEGVSGGQFLELRSIQCTPFSDVKMVVSVDKDDLLTLHTQTLGESPEKALGVFIIADERKNLKAKLINNGGSSRTVYYLLNALLKKKAE